MHRKFNSMSIVAVERVTLLDIKSAIFGFYKSLPSEFEPWRLNIEGLFLLSLRDFDEDFIEIPFSEEEVTKALLDCYGDSLLNLMI